MTTEGIYSTKQVCAALGISRATLYTWSDAEPDVRLDGALGWRWETIVALAVAHGRTINVADRPDAAGWTS